MISWTQIEPAQPGRVEPSTFLGLESTAWDAITSISTLVALAVAIFTARTALHKYRAGTAARRDQTRPYIIVSV